MTIFKKTRDNNKGKDERKGNTLGTLGEIVNWCSHYVKQYGGASKIKNRTTMGLPSWSSG